MICSKCTHWHEPQVRVRCTPTFYHSPIFGGCGCGGYAASYPKQCSATYHSNVFDDSLNQNQNRCCCYDVKEKRDKIVTEKKSIQNKGKSSSVAKFRKQTDLYPHNHLCASTLGSRGVTNHDLLWYNPQKQVLLMNCSDCWHHGLPRQRKLIEMSSCPFYNYGSAVRQINQCCQPATCRKSSVPFRSSKRTPTNKASCDCGNPNCRCPPNCICCPKQEINIQSGSGCGCGNPNCQCPPNCQCCPKQQNRQCSNPECKCENCNCSPCNCGKQQRTYQQQCGNCCISNCPQCGCSATNRRFQVPRVMNRNADICSNGYEQRDRKRPQTASKSTMQNTMAKNSTKYGSKATGKPVFKTVNKNR